MQIESIIANAQEALAAPVLAAVHHPGTMPITAELLTDATRELDARLTPARELLNQLRGPLAQLDQRVTELQAGPYDALQGIALLDQSDRMRVLDVIAPHFGPDGSSEQVLDVLTAHPAINADLAEHLGRPLAWARYGNHSSADVPLHIDTIVGGPSGFADDDQAATAVAAKIAEIGSGTGFVITGTGGHSHGVVSLVTPTPISDTVERSRTMGLGRRQVILTDRPTIHRTDDRISTTVPNALRAEADRGPARITMAQLGDAGLLHPHVSDLDRAKAAADRAREPVTQIEPVVTAGTNALRAMTALRQQLAEIGEIDGRVGEGDALTWAGELLDRNMKPMSIVPSAHLGLATILPDVTPREAVLHLGMNDSLPPVTHAVLMDDQGRTAVAETDAKPPLATPTNPVGSLRALVDRRSLTFTAKRPDGNWSEVHPLPSLAEIERTLGPALGEKLIGTSAGEEGRIGPFSDAEAVHVLPRGSSLPHVKTAAIQARKADNGTVVILRTTTAVGPRWALSRWVTAEGKPGANGANRYFAFINYLPEEVFGFADKDGIMMIRNAPADA